MTMRFEHYLLCEGKVNLAHKIGDILTALQSLSEDSNSLSKRAMERGVTQVVDQIRRILHDRWEDSERPYLLSLQKVAVALMNALSETDGDMPSVLASAVAEIERASSKLEEPINSVGSEKDSVDDRPEDGVGLDSELPDELGSDE